MKKETGKVYNKRDKMGFYTVFSLRGQIKIYKNVPWEWWDLVPCPNSFVR